MLRGKKFLLKQPQQNRDCQRIEGIRNGRSGLKSDDFGPVLLSVITGDLMKKNITLIGMPGAGKSTIGVILAKRLGFRFLDSDLLIQEQEHRLLKEIIAEEGNEGFQRIENQVNRDIDVERTVIAPGGSVIYCEEAMAHLKEISWVVFLQVDYDQLEQRLGDLVARGVTLKPGQTLQELLEERGKLYEKYADYTINERGMTSGRVAAVLEETIIEKDFVDIHY